MSIKPLPLNKVIGIASGTRSFYINFTALNDLTISKADYEDSKFVRKIAIVNRFKILTVLLMPTVLNLTTTETINIFLHAVGSNSTSIPGKSHNVQLKIELNSLNATSLISKDDIKSIDSDYVSKITTSTLKMPKTFAPIKPGTQLEPEEYTNNTEPYSFMVSTLTFLFL